MAINGFSLLPNLVVLATAIFILTLYRHITRRKREPEYRAQLQHTVQELRLGAMLRVLGISLERYTRQAPVRDIERHIRACAACVDLKRCGACLRSGKPVPDMSFCPNQTALRALRSKYRPAMPHSSL